MLSKHLTAAAANNVWPQQAKKVRITVNAALTGTITLSDETGTTGTPVIAIITNPTVGSFFEYWGLQLGVCVTPSALCDITVSVDYSRGGLAA